MHDIEARDMMQRCVEEIQSLRAQIEHLKPLADAYLSIQQVLGLMPQRSVGMSESLAWRLRQRIDELNKAIEEAGKATKQDVDDAPAPV